MRTMPAGDPFVVATLAPSRRAVTCARCARGGGRLPAARARRAAAAVTTRRRARRPGDRRDTHGRGRRSRPPRRSARRSRRSRHPTRRRARLRADADDHPDGPRRGVRRVAPAAERTSRTRRADELSEHIAALLIITCQFDPADDAIVKSAMGARQRSTASGPASCSACARSRKGVSAKIVLAPSSWRVKRSRASWSRHADRFELVNAVAALALAGEADEALAGLARVIDIGAAARRSARGANPRAVARAGVLRGGRAAARRRRRSRSWSRRRSGRCRSPARLSRRLPRARPARARQDRGGARKSSSAVSVDELLPGHRIQLLHGRGRLRLATGAAEQALADFVAAGEAAESVDIRNPAYIPWRSQSALALRQLERIDEARVLAREELKLSRRWGAPRTIGVSLRALGLVEGGRSRRAVAARGG